MSGLTKVPSEMPKGDTPRVGEAMVQMECKVVNIQGLIGRGGKPGNPVAPIVQCEIQAICLDPSVLLSEFSLEVAHIKMWCRHIARLLVVLITWTSGRSSQLVALEPTIMRGVGTHLLWTDRRQILNHQKSS